MAGKTLSARDTLSMESVRKFLNKDLVQECAALSLLLVVAFMILSIASYDPADVAGAVWPVNAEPHNLGGRIGAVAVHYAYTFLGVGTYLLVGVIGVYATLIFFRRKAADWPVRLIGTVLLVATFSAMFGDSYAESGIMPSRGGVIGTTVFGLLAANFGLTGTYLVLSFTMLLSFLLATDILFYPIIRDLLHPLGDDDEAISGPLTPPEIPDPIMPHELESKEGGNWLTRMLKRGKPEVIEEESDEDESEIVFEPDLALIPADPEPAPSPEPHQVGARRPAVERAAPEPEPVDSMDWEAALASYRLPEVAMLNAGKKRDNNRAKAEMTRCAEIIRATFAHFRMDVRVVDSIPGPTVTTYEMEIPPDVMLSKVERVKDNLALNLRVHGVRFVTQAGKSTVGIEVPNHTREMVSFREILETAEFEAASKKFDLPMAFGKDALGTPVIRDLAAMPHLLVGGATGQGKSVFENVLLASLLMSRSPRDLRMVMVDPKQVEFAPYRDIPHLLAPVIDDSRRAVSVFEWLAEEMERRYTLFKHTGVRKMSEYNELSNRERRKRLEDAGADPDSESHLPSIVAIVDELADLILVASDTKIDELIARIAAKARAAGIHLILVTQSPRADVLNGLIKSNIPARVSLRVNTGSESRIVLDQTGAEDLMGKGDLLMVMPGDPRAIRVQSAFIADDEMNRMLDSLRSQLKPNYVIDPSQFSGGGGEAAHAGGVGELDPDFVAAVDQVMAAGRGSASFLRTAMGLGHTRATRIIIQMERAGILGPNRGSKEREILITFEEWEARKASGSPAEHTVGA